MQAEDGKPSATSTPTLEERDELQEQMEEFLRSQAEQESGTPLTVFQGQATIAEALSWLQQSRVQVKCHWRRLQTHL